MNPRATHLKIKIVNLADEARTIRKEERKALEAAREEGTSDLYNVYFGLREHRTGIVRNAARTNLLAYGFLRGRSYAQMEQKTSEAPDFYQVFKVVKRFGTPEDLLRWETWQDEARAHLTEQGFNPNCIVWARPSSKYWQEIQAVLDSKADEKEVA